MDAQFAFVQPDHALFADTWSSRLAPSTPECSQYYIDALVSSEPDKQHLWVLGQTSDGEPIAVAYFSIQAVEFVLGSMVKVLTLGGSLSANAFWIDTSRAAYENVMREMLRFCAKHLRYHVVLLKPFDASQQATPLLHNEKDLGFINVYASTQAEVDLSGIESYEGYTATLEKKKRYYLRKVQKDADLSGLRVEITEDFAAAVPEIYPLYLSVNERASEMKDNDPLPPQYFEKLSILSALNSKAVLIRKDDRLVGFLILLEKNSVLWCGPCGIDHGTVKQFNTWYLLIHEAIKYAIAARSERAILGTTNFSMKKKFGAQRTELWISLRFRSLLLTRSLTPFVRFWLKKNVFSAEIAGDAPGRSHGGQLTPVLTSCTTPNAPHSHSQVMTAKAIFPIAVLCALLALSACRSPAPTATAQTTAPLANVTLERLRQTEVPQLLDLSGTLEATSRASIAAVTAGRILSDPAQVGLSVRAGQVLFRLDDEEARKHVARAEQALQAAEIDRNINQSVADKYAALARSGDVSQLSADQQIAAAQGHDAAAASDAIDLQLARKALQDDTVLSPIAGVVSEKKHFLGETVAPGEELADIITLHPIRLAMQVPAEVASKLKSGLRVTAASPEGGVLQGFVSLLHPTMDPATRYVTVDALFPNTDGALRPGQFLAARIRLPGVRAVFTLPRSAITVDPATQSAEIYTFEAGHVSRVIVQAGPVFEDRQQITASALQPGQFVVIYTDRTLEDGMAAHAGSR